MGTPVLFVVDEDRTALEALAADLDRRFGADYQILAEPSPTAALTRPGATGCAVAAGRAAAGRPADSRDERGGVLGGRP